MSIHNQTKTEWIALKIEGEKMETQNVGENGEILGSQFMKSVSKYIVIPFGAKEFTVHENSNVEELKKAGHNISIATFTYGCMENIMFPTHESYRKDDA